MTNLISYLGDFKEGVRIFVLSDSCHSGSVSKGANLQKTLEIDKFTSNIDKLHNKYRFAPDHGTCSAHMIKIKPCMMTY